MNENSKEDIISIILFILIIFGIALFLWRFSVYADNAKKPSDNILICKNVQKFYKDDILFDNFYIGCDNTTLEVNVEQYSSIIEKEDYKITFDNIGMVYSMERIDDNE